MVKFVEIVFIERYSFLVLVFLSFNLLLTGLRYNHRVSDRQFFSLSRRLFFAVFLVVSLRIIFLYLAQYLLWSSAEPFTYFLPPYQPVSYFFSYSWFHFARPLIFNLCLSLFFFFLIFLGTQFSRGRFFYPEEHYSGGVALLLNSWPENLLVLVLVLGIGCLSFSLRAIYLWLSKRELSPQPIYFSFRFLWAGVGLLIFLAGRNLVGVFQLESLRI